MGGHNKTISAPDYTGVQIQTSAMALPVPLAWGKSRGSPNLIQMTDFATAQRTVGKGGAAGKGKENTYAATLVLALCEGPITGITKTYVDQGYQNGYTDSGFTLFTGTTPQAPWSYMVAKHPNQAYGYQGICYLAAANYSLGTSEALPNFSFEGEWPLYNSGYTGNGDADCALVVEDFLTSAQYGAGFPTTRLDTTTLLSGPHATTTGDSAYQTYCRAMGWGISPFIQNQEAGTDILSRWMQITNTAPVWTGYSLKFIPYGDDTVTGNGVTYVPPTASVFSFGDDDYYQGDGGQENDTDPVQMTIRDPFDAYNRISISCSIREYDYNAVPIDYVDQTQAGNLSVNPLGPRPASQISAREICETAMATQVVSLIAQRMTYNRNGYVAKFGPEYFLYEPMDVGTITETLAGIVGQAVRITEIEEGEDDILTFTFEEFPGTLGRPTTNVSTTPTGSGINSLVAPDPVNQPIIFEPNSAAAQFITGSDAPCVIAAVSGGSGGAADPNWGGCDVFVSADGTSYAYIGQILGPARMGTLTASLASYGGANPDTAHTLSVSLAESNGTLQSATSGATAAAGATLCVIQDGAGGAVEFVGPETASLTGANAYNLTNLYRGLFGTTAGAHSTGALFARLDNAIFSYQLPLAYIGVTLHFKFQSFNIWGQALEDLSTCTAYSYTPTGAGFGGGSAGVPTTPTGLSASGQIQAVALSWAANPSTDNVTAYEIWRATGSGQPFSSASKVATVSGQAFVDTGLLSNQAYTYFLVADNAVGSSGHTAGVNVTTSGLISGGGASATVTASQALSAGDFVNVYDNSGTLAVRKADATDPTKFCNGFVLGAIANGASGVVNFTGMNTSVSPTARGKVWLSGTTPGSYQSSAPANTDAGKISQPLGTAVPGVGIAFQPAEPFGAI